MAFQTTIASLAAYGCNGVKTLRAGVFAPTTKVTIITLDLPEKSRHPGEQTVEAADRTKEMTKGAMSEYGHEQNHHHNHHPRDRHHPLRAAKELGDAGGVLRKPGYRPRRTEIAKE